MTPIRPHEYRAGTLPGPRTSHARRADSEGWSRANGQPKTHPFPPPTDVRRRAWLWLGAVATILAGVPVISAAPGADPAGRASSKFDLSGGGYVVEMAVFSTDLHWLAIPRTANGAGVARTRQVEVWNVDTGAKAAGWDLDVAPIGLTRPTTFLPGAPKLLVATPTNVAAWDVRP